MDISAKLREISARIPALIDNLKTEEAAKHSLVLPFIQALGYDVFNPSEVVPEFDANVGASKTYKLDYAILQDNKPIILIECKAIHDKLNDKAREQLFHYFAATHARIGILTNGLIYKFYADLDKANVMDDEPFLEVDMQNLKDSQMDELAKISKSSFNIDEMVLAANQLKYITGIINILNQQLASPSDDFAKVFFSQLCPGKVFSPNAKNQFTDYTKKAMNLFLKEQVMNRFASEEDALPTQIVPLRGGEDDQDLIAEKTDLIVTTEDELQGFYIVKSLSYGIVDASRVTWRDNQSYFNVLLDDNKLKPICRLYFNNPNNRKIGLFDHSQGEKKEEKIAVSELDEIYQYGDRLKTTILHYLEKTAA
jgi:predicted type IV restriction endonuclease